MQMLYIRDKEYKGSQRHLKQTQLLELGIERLSGLIFILFPIICIGNFCTNGEK